MLTLATAISALHLDPPLADHLPLITTNAARAIGLAHQLLDRIPAHRLMLTEATDMASLLTAQSPRRPLLA
jgi:cytosine deaminase